MLGIVKISGSISRMSVRELDTHSIKIIIGRAVNFYVVDCEAMHQWNFKKDFWSIVDKYKNGERYKLVDVIDFKVPLNPTGRPLRMYGYLTCHIW